MSLFNKISSEDMYGMSYIDTFDILRKFKELYEYLLVDDKTNAKTIINGLGPKITLFSEYLKAKNPNEHDNIMKSLTGILNNTVIEQKLVESLKLDGKAFIGSLAKLRRMMFPDEGAALVNPEFMSYKSVDFFSDDGMWEWIADALKREISSNDSEAIDIIKKSIQDLLND